MRERRLVEVWKLGMGKVEWGVVEVELAEQQARLHRQVSLRYMCTYYIYIYI